MQPLNSGGPSRALVVVDGFNDPPVIEYYLHNVQGAQRLTRVQEVDVITDARQQAAVAAQFVPASGLKLAAQEIRGTLALSRFTAPHPILMPPTTSPRSGASILVHHQRARR